MEYNLSLAIVALFTFVLGCQSLAEGPTSSDLTESKTVSAYLRSYLSNHPSVRTDGLTASDVRVWLEDGIRPDAQDEDGETLLSFACGEASYKTIKPIVSLLVSRGSDINARNSADDRTPFEAFLFSNDLLCDDFEESLRFFISQGAKIKQSNLLRNLQVEGRTDFLDCPGVKTMLQEQGVVLEEPSN